MKHKKKRANQDIGSRTEIACASEGRCIFLQYRRQPTGSNRDPLAATICVISVMTVSCVHLIYNSSWKWKFATAPAGRRIGPARHAARTVHHSCMANPPLNWAGRRAGPAIYDNVPGSTSGLITTQVRHHITTKRENYKRRVKSLIFRSAKLKQFFNMLYLDLSFAGPWSNVRLLNRKLLRFLRSCLKKPTFLDIFRDFRKKQLYRSKDIKIMHSKSHAIYCKNLFGSTPLSRQHALVYPSQREEIIKEK